MERAGFELEVPVAMIVNFAQDVFALGLPDVAPGVVVARRQESDDGIGQLKSPSSSGESGRRRQERPHLALRAFVVNDAGTARTHGLRETEAAIGSNAIT